jgi:hypothetical protein
LRRERVSTKVLTDSFIQAAELCDGVLFLQRTKRASVGGELEHLRAFLAVTAEIPKDRLARMAYVCMETSGIEARRADGNVHIRRESRVKLMWSPAYHPENIWLAVDSDSGAVAYCGIDATDATRAFEDAESRRQLAVAKAAAKAAAKAKAEAAAAKRFCVNCDRTSEGGKFRVCMGCKSARYCSRACQIAHWKAGHRDVCRSLSE